MPPKRKRADDAASEASSTSTRATRASARAARSRTATVETEGTPGADVPDAVETAPQAKRTRKAAGPRTQAKGAVAVNTQEPRSDARTQEAASAPVTKPAKPTKSSEPGPYSAASATSLFSSYADPDDPTVVGPEGFERLCSDADISLEGALPLILAWQLQASEMAKISKSEWEKATTDLRISSLPALSAALHDLEDLLLLNKPALRPSAQVPAPAKKKPTASSAPSDPYNRSRYYGYASDTKKAFNELYAFCFALAKPPGARNIDMDTASAFWSVLLVPKHPLMSDILRFINERGTYKGVNKDLWSMTLEFVRVVRPDLSNYDPEGAWPTLLDDFVTWKNSNSAGVDAPIQVDA